MTLTRIAVCVLAVATIAAAQAPRNLIELFQQFQNPPDDARIMMRWWWFGPSVEKAELEREMRLMKEGGIGGFEVQPVYPVMLDDPERGFRNYPYMSDEFLDALKFTSQKAKELGLRMDLTLGSGWPFGGPHIRVTEAAGRLRCDRVVVAAGAKSVAMPDVGVSEKFIAAFLAKGDARTFAPDGIRRVTEIERGRLKLPADLGAGHVVLFFVASRSGMQLKRPGIGGEGFVLDHYDRAAIERHLKVQGDKLMSAFGANKPYAVFSDSLEVYNSDWTGDFLEQFQKRRGYDLTPFLPALASDIGEKTGDVRRDWGRTLTELVDERYLTPLRDWANKNGTRLRSQTYGTPPVVLSSNNLVDLPEGEGFHWRQFSSTRWATSGSHLYGKPVTSSETWTWLHSPSFRATPLDMKAEADLHFLQGVNQLIGHGWPYSPPIAGEPGWRFYAAAVFNEHNPWWIVMPEITKYLQRVSWLLRQGKPVIDVALYLPTEDAWESFGLGRTSVNQAMERLLPENLIPQILDAGYNFDFIDDRAIEQMGVAHPVLVIPPLKRMPAATQAKIDEYRRKGGKVLDLRGRAADGVGAELAKLHPADLPGKDPAVGFVHRKLDFADVYFVANTSNKAARMPSGARDTARRVCWDLMTASETLCTELAPYQSVVMFPRVGPEGSRQHTERPVSLDLSDHWRVSFPEFSGTMLELESWTADEQTKFYSGSAIYEKAVRAPVGPWVLTFGVGTPVEPERRPNGMRALLESPVREAAQVYINGQFAGSVWYPPYELDVSKFMKVGDNQIRIVVANTAINAMAGQSLPDYRLLNLRYTERFTPQDMNNLKPLPSGILGTVRLVSR